MIYKLFEPKESRLEICVFGSGIWSAGEKCWGSSSGRLRRRGDDEGLGAMYNRETSTWGERLTRSGITDSESWRVLASLGRTTPTAREVREWEAWTFSTVTSEGNNCNGRKRLKIA